MSEIIGFCYATASGVGGWLAMYGQAIIILGGLTIGLIFAVTYRNKNKNRKYQP